MHLCIDIGNTKSKVAVFKKGEIIEKWKRKTVGEEWIGKVLAEFPIKASIISNTRGFNEAARKVLASETHFIPLNHETPIPITNNYATPETLGRDRLAVVCAAHSRWKNQNVLIIDAGTCITYDAISKEGIYNGGSIHPGLTMRFKALNNYTGKLPLVKKQIMMDFIGDSTQNSILAGVAYATVKEMEGMIAAYKVKFGELKVIITGGDASFFVTQVKSKIFAHSNLVLKGLNKILEYNVERL